jgi:hypothetical protein
VPEKLNLVCFLTGSFPRTRWPNGGALDSNVSVPGSNPTRAQNQFVVCHLERHSGLTGPVRGSPQKYIGEKIVRQGRRSHKYGTLPQLVGTIVHTFIKYDKYKYM